MATTIICDDCRGEIADGETICRTCVETKDAEISDLQDRLRGVKSERDDYASQLEDARREKSK